MSLWMMSFTDTGQTEEDEEREGRKQRGDGIEINEDMEGKVTKNR